MEDYQSENDNVDIREWAQQIREQKIWKLRSNIAFKQKIYESYKDEKPITVEGHMHIVLSRAKLVDDLCKLKDKLRILER